MSRNRIRPLLEVLTAALFLAAFALGVSSSVFFSEGYSHLLCRETGACAHEFPWRVLAAWVSLSAGFCCAIGLVTSKSGVPILESES